MNKTQKTVAGAVALILAVLLAIAVSRVACKPGDVTAPPPTTNVP